MSGADDDYVGFSHIGSIHFVIPGHRAAMNPESRDSGFDASHRPGMTFLFLSEDVIVRTALCE